MYTDSGSNHVFPPTTQIQRTDLCVLTTVTLPYIEHHRSHGQTKDNVDRNFPSNLCVIFFQNDYIYLNVLFPSDADHFIFVKKLGIYMADLRTITLIHL